MRFALTLTRPITRCGSILSPRFEAEGRRPSQTTQVYFAATVNPRFAEEVVPLPDLCSWRGDGVYPATGFDVLERCTVPE